MNKTCRVKITVSLLTWLALLIAHPYPPLREGAISLFFIENKNHETFQLVEQEPLVDQSDLIQELTIQLQKYQKRSRVISFSLAAITLIFGVTFLVICSMRKKVNEALSELVKKNLSKMRSTQQMNVLIKKRIEIESHRASEQLTGEQKDFLIFSNFKEWLEKDKQYLRSDLDLNTVARELGTNRSYLSKSINSRGTRFTEFVNQYRVQEVLSIFEDETDVRNSLTLQEIASEAGFHTKSVFFDAFRKETGMTPKQFKEYLRYSKISEN